VIDATRLRATSRIEVGQRPRSTAFSGDGSRAYVMNEVSSNLSVIDVAGLRVTGTFPLAGAGLLPMSGTVSPDGTVIYVTTGRAGLVIALASSDGSVRGKLAAGTRPWGMAMSPDGTRVYTANGPSNDVSVIDTRAWRVAATIPVGKKPWGAACVPESR
jgi:YVTN family beta-propeller protein